MDLSLVNGDFDTDLSMTDMGRDFDSEMVSRYEARDVVPDPSPVDSNCPAWKDSSRSCWFTRCPMLFIDICFLEVAGGMTLVTSSR